MNFQVASVTAYPSVPLTPLSGPFLSPFSLIFFILPCGVTRASTRARVLLPWVVLSLTAHHQPQQMVSAKDSPIFPFVPSHPCTTR